MNKSPTCWKNIGIPSKVPGNVLAKCFPKKAGIAATLAFLLISVADPDHIDADPDFLSQIRKNAADPDHHVDRNPDFHSQIRKNVADPDHHVDKNPDFHSQIRNNVDPDHVDANPDFFSQIKKVLLIRIMCLICAAGVIH